MYKSDKQINCPLLISFLIFKLSKLWLNWKIDVCRIFFSINPKYYTGWNQILWEWIKLFCPFSKWIFRGSLLSCKKSTSQTRWIKMNKNWIKIYSFNPYCQISGKRARPFYWKTHPIDNWRILGRHTVRFTGKIIH